MKASILAGYPEANFLGFWHFCEVSSRPQSGRYQGKSGRSADIAFL